MRPREQDLGRALHEHAQLAGILGIEMDGGVALALRRERDFGNAPKASLLRIRHAEFARRDDQRPLRRIPLHAPAIVAVHERGVVCERCCLKRLRSASQTARSGRAARRRP